MHGTVTKTLIQGLSDKMVQARLNSFDARPFLFATYFPTKKVNGFNWKTLSNVLTAKNVAADINSDNATILRKRRDKFEMASGDIPYLTISREMTRSDIKDYQQALSMTDDPDAIKLIQYWGDDVDFCTRGIQSELEYIAWKMASNAGKLAFTSSTNATFATQFDLDYQVDDAMKRATSSDWRDNAKADILGDLAKLIEYAKKKNMNPKFGFINLRNLYNISSSDQIIKASASYIQNAVGMAQTPDLETINKALAKQAWLNGIQLRVIDTDVTRESLNGEQITGNPFDDDRLILSETETLGSTQYDVLKDNSSYILRAERAHTVVKKYGTIEPLGEVTIGEADAFPVFDSAYRNMYISTNGVEWK